MDYSIVVVMPGARASGEVQEKAGRLLFALRFCFGDRVISANSMKRQNSASTVIVHLGGPHELRKYIAQYEDFPIVALDLCGRAADWGRIRHHHFGLVVTQWRFWPMVHGQMVVGTIADPAREMEKTLRAIQRWVHVHRVLHPSFPKPSRLTQARALIILFGLHMAFK